MNNEYQIIIDAGHGGNDTGAVANGYIEKELNLKVALKLQDLLKEYFSNILMTRTEDISFNLSERARWVGEKARSFHGKTFCLSIHFNAFNGIARGTETIHSIFTKPDLAISLANNIISLGLPLRRVFSRESNTNRGQDFYAMHRLTGRAETIIIEPLFLDNLQDVEFLQKKNFLDHLAKTYLKGLLEHCEIELIENKTNWKYTALEKLHNENLLDDLDLWKQRIDEPMPVWTAYLMLWRIYEKSKNK